MKILCRIVGHKPSLVAEYDGYSEYSCDRCKKQSYVFTKKAFTMTLGVSVENNVKGE